MATHAHIVEALLNEARPRLREGWSVRETGCGEATVASPGCRLAVIAENGVPLLSLLDGTHTLNEVAAKLLARRGRVRHRTLLDTLVRLSAAGMLEPLGAEIDNYLRREARALRGPVLSRATRRLASIPLLLPVRLGSGRGGKGGGVDGRWLALVAALLFVGAVAPFAGGLLRNAFGAGAFGADPLTGMVLALAGVVIAASWREVVRAVLLLRMGRVVRGLGVRLSVGIPHLAVDSDEEALLDREERIRYRAGLLLALVLAAGAAAVAVVAGVAAAWPLGLGIHAVLLFDLAPFWPGDGCLLLEEVLGHRGLGRVSRFYVVRTLWRRVTSLRKLSREDMELLLFATFQLLFLFVGAAALAFVLPSTVDGLATAFLDPASGGGSRILALAVALFLACSACLLGLALLAAVVGGLFQLAGGRRRQGRPAEVRRTDSLPLDELVAEVGLIPPFSGLPAGLVGEALEAGRLERYAPGTVIIAQGAPGRTCYVIRSGRCRVLVEEASGRTAEVATLGPGHLFGEVALLEAVPRTASVVAGEETEVIALDGERFLDLVARSDVDRERITEQIRIHLFLQKIELFQGLSGEGLRAILRAVRVHRFQAGDVVVRQGEEGYSMFIIHVGRCDVVADGREVATLGAGDYFGEIALVTGTVRTATVRCATAAVLVEVPAQSYQEIIVGEFATGLLVDREVEARLEGLGVHWRG